MTINMDHSFDTRSSRVLKVSFSECLSLAKALSTQLRIDMYEALMENSMNVAEVAERFNLPISTAASNINILEDAGLIVTDLVPGTRGRQKMCAAIVSAVFIETDAKPATLGGESFIEIPMPVGNFTQFSVAPTCGLASDSSIIGELDDPSSFYEPMRTGAQLIWFHKGFLEYQFPNRIPQRSKISSLELTMEICSEAPLHNPNWPSDITVWVNDVEVGTWTSPGDFGGERGFLTPEWWPTHQTQYGLLKTWKISSHGTLLDGRGISDVTLDDLWDASQKGITVRIGVKDDATNVGGVNLFGKGFGNYQTDIVMRLGYKNI